MNSAKYLEGACTECGMTLRFPAEMVGTVAQCPRCGKQTELLLAAPPDEPAVPRRMILLTVIALIILGGGLVGSLIALKRAEKWAARLKNPAATETTRNSEQALPTPPTPDAGPTTDRDGFRVSAIKLEKSPGAARIYAVGTASNLLSQPRFKVQVQLDLLDATGQKVGLAMDSIEVIQPAGLWNFRAPVLVEKAATAKLASVTEAH